MSGMPLRPTCPCPDDPICPHRAACPLAQLLARLEADDGPDWTLDDLAYVLHLPVTRVRADWIAHEFVARSHHAGAWVRVPHEEARPYLLRMLGRRRVQVPVPVDRRSGLDRRNTGLSARAQLVIRLQEDDGPPWKTGDVALLFGVSRETIRAWIVLGEFPGAPARRRGWVHVPHGAVRACAQRRGLLEH